MYTVNRLNAPISFTEMGEKMAFFSGEEGQFGLFSRQIRAVATSELFSIKQRKGELYQKNRAIQRMIEKTQLSTLSRTWKEKYICEIHETFQSFLLRLFWKGAKERGEDRLLEIVYIMEASAAIQLFRRCADKHEWAREHLSFMRRFQTQIKEWKQLGQMGDGDYKRLSVMKIWRRLDQMYADPIDLVSLQKSAPFLKRCLQG